MQRLGAIWITNNLFNDIHGVGRQSCGEKDIAQLLDVFLDWIEVRGEVRQDLVVERQGIHHDGSLGPSHEGKVTPLSNHLAIPNAEHGFLVVERLVPHYAILTAIHRTDPDQHVE